MATCPPGPARTVVVIPYDHGMRSSSRLITFALTLIASIAWVSGRTLSPRAAGEFLAGLGANVGAAFAFREAARALVKYLFPGGGSAVSGAVAFAGTMAVGAAARAYFIRGESIRGARRAYRSASHDGDASSR